MFHRECFARYLGLAYLGLCFLDKRVPDFLSICSQTYNTLHMEPFRPSPPPPPTGRGDNSDTYKITTFFFLFLFFLPLYWEFTNKFNHEALTAFLPSFLSFYHLSRGKREKAYGSKYSMKGLVNRDKIKSTRGTDAKTWRTKLAPPNPILPPDLLIEIF